VRRARFPPPEFTCKIPPARVFLYIERAGPKRSQSLRASPKALEEWILSVAPRAVAYARTLLDRPDRAEDIVQDVLLRLLDHPEYDLLRDGEKLLFTSITNACINEVTRRRTLRSLHADRPDEAAPIDDLASGRARNPADALVSREMLDAVGAELRRLPPMQRAAVELKAMGRSLRQIAETLRVSPSNAGVLVHRARRRLKEKLGPHLPGELR